MSGLAKMLSLYSPRVIKHAEKSRSNGDLIRVDDLTWEAVSSDGERIYTQRVIGVDEMWVTCTCPNGQHLGGQPQCWHTAAVLLALEEQREREADDA